jgi:hypothetical protein
MSVSLTGVIGAAILGTIGAITALLVLGFVETRLRERDESQTPQERESFERKVAAMRQIVVIVDTVTFAALGYWLGQLVGG